MRMRISAIRPLKRSTTVGRFERGERGVGVPSPSVTKRSVNSSSPRWDSPLRGRQRCPNLLPADFPLPLSVKIFWILAFTSAARKRLALARSRVGTRWVYLLEVAPLTSSVMRPAGPQ